MDVNFSTSKLKAVANFARHFVLSEKFVMQSCSKCVKIRDNSTRGRAKINRIVTMLKGERKRGRERERDYGRRGQTRKEAGPTTSKWQPQNEIQINKYTRLSTNQQSHTNTHLTTHSHTHTISRSVHLAKGKTISLHATDRA